jgi:signal transduction histidine kinase
MSFSKTFAQQPRAWILTEMAACLLVIGVLDYITSYKFRLLPFYGGPIFVMAWFFGKRVGIVAAIFSGVIWWCANWFSGDPDLRSWIWAWETGRHIGFFSVVAWIASVLRTKSDLAAARIALLEHSQRLEREIVKISEAEQRRIGEDLHDGLCQYLAGLGCAATSLRDDLQELQHPAKADQADELAKMLQHAVVQTRDLARGLVPTHVGDVGLVVALESLARSVIRLRGVTCTFQFQGRAVKCDEHTAIHVYRIAQEAINNATRHGKARNIVISLDTADHTMTLRVLDDGVGISEPFSTNGLGIGIMRSRARLAGGELTIERPKSGGTLVSCTARTNHPESESAVA